MAGLLSVAEDPHELLSLSHELARLLVLYPTFHTP